MTMANDLIDAQNTLAEVTHLLQALIMAGNSLDGIEGNAISTTAMVAMEKVEAAEAAIQAAREAKADA
jgi:hypothetical protein